MGKGVGVNRTPVWRAVGVLLALTTAGAACGSGGSKDKQSTRATAAEVTAGLRQIDGLGAQISLAARADAKSAKGLNAGIEPAWRAIEGTVRANDKDLYIR